jgi:hypothetical protein
MSGRIWRGGDTIIRVRGMTEEEAKTKWQKGCVGFGSYEEKYPLLERIDDLSVGEPNSGCKLWLGALNDSGYARIKVKSRFRRAHIVAYELFNGKVPLGLVLDHKCRTRCCVNPNHLEAVTLAENLRRGRLARGMSR